MKFGGRKVAYEIDDPALRAELLKEWNDGRGTLDHYPMRSAWSSEYAVNGPMLSAGGGFDVAFTQPFAWRVINLEYSHSWMNSVDGVRPQNGLLIATEAVVLIGNC